jgi:undecaprenyl-diphosphatase
MTLSVSEQSGWFDWLRHHLRRSEYLGFHLVAGWLLSLVLLGVFLAISRLIGPQNPVARWDERVAHVSRQDREASPSVRAIFVQITNLGSVQALTVVVLIAGTVLLFRRRRLLLLICLLGPLAGGIIDAGLKSWFERPRPLLRDPAILESTMSFPSGHSLGSMVTYGLVAYFIVQARHKHPLRWLAIPVAALLVLLIGCSRVYLNAHYPTDVLAGWALGGCWLATCVTGIESVKIHHRSRQVTQSSLSAQS